MGKATAVSDLERAEHLPYGDGAGVKRVSIYNDGVQINAATDMVVTNALDVAAFNLQTALYSGTTNISNDYIFDGITLNFSTAESKTITITLADGTVLYSDTNTERNVQIQFDKAINGGENITVSVTQTPVSCLMDLKLVIKQGGGGGLSGNPVLGAGNEHIGSVSIDNRAEVTVHDHVTQSIVFIANKKIGNPVLSLPISMGDTTITLQTGHGFVIGDYIAIQEGSKVYQSEVKNVVSNIITVGCPSDNNFTVGAFVIREQTVTSSLNGSITPVSLTIKPQIWQKWHFREMSIFLNCSSTLDLTKFGDIVGGLTNGILIRKVNGTYENLFCASKNSDIYYKCKNNEFLEKPYYSYKATFNFLEQTGSILELDGNNGEYFECLIRDNLTTLLEFKIFLTGHIAD